MLKLKNVSKYYYNKGLVTSGFSKINLDLDIGEFVVITGASGSGKTTLLNVISGIDTYEDGEMYINGLETSHYNEIDFENYRKKYIANIFQNFNLINSYTVYQNIELILLINGFNKKDIKEKVLNLIKQVSLEKYTNKKVSKLSGGQKQRVAIARALAKDTPIIIADEPTGNLDKKSSESILKLLYSISSNKLVIVVTHDYDQISEYATRKIKMHDGKIIEDKIIKNKKEVINPETYNFNNITFLNKLRLGIRNTFNIIPKFLLLLFIYIFLSVAVMSEYTSYKSSTYENSLNGYNQFFSNTSDKRIVIKKNNNELFTESDYDKINKLNNIDYIIKDDILLDTDINISNDNLYLYGYINDINLFKGKVDYGRLPESEYEILVFGSEKDYYLNDKREEVINKEYQIETRNGIAFNFSNKLKIVGIVYEKENAEYTYGNSTFYVNNKLIEEIKKSINVNFSNIETLFNNTILKSYQTDSINMIYPTDEIESGYSYISDSLNYLCPNLKCKNNKMTINVKNIYYNDKINLTVKDTYNKNNFKNILKNLNYDELNGSIFINSDDYYNLFNKGNYQSSVFIKNEKEVTETLKELEDLNLNTLYIKDAMVNPNETINIFLNIFVIIVILILLIFVFFITYFIIKLIFKSRNIYFSTLRILGSTKKSIKDIIDIELFTITSLAYLIIIIFIILNKIDIIESSYIKNLIEYLKLNDYIILYLFLILMSKLLSRRFSRNLFKKSAMNTYREEV